ncbi:hypothetical protein PAT01_33290 [Pseudoalteromonas atlantica]|uniref:HEAT repeat domain-containing protein n=1 Tax=Pseudoalteromonas atlantica TaxID=288 RepID=A0ABQ0UHT0_PSEAF|nr:hypothetical protein PAT01_33290 [Pseudoalteromonas atlantica]
MKFKIAFMFLLVSMFLIYKFYSPQETNNSGSSNALNKGSEAGLKLLNNLSMGSQTKQFELCSNNLETLKTNDDYSTCVDSVLINENKRLLREQAKLVEPIYLAWIYFNWQEALLHLTSLKLELQDFLIKKIAYTVGQIDLQELLIWIDNSKLNNDIKAKLITAGYLSYMESRPETVLEEVSYLSNTSIKMAVIDNLLMQWGVQDTLEALSWIEQQPRPDMYMRLILPMLTALIDKDTSLAEETILLLDDSQIKYDAVAYFTQKLASDDIESSESWVLSLPGGPVRQAGLRRLVEVMATQRVELSRILDIILAENDLTLQGKLLTNLVATSPEKGLDALKEIIPTLSFPIAVRKSLLAALTKRLIAQNPDATKIWLNSLTPSEETSYAKRLAGENMLASSLSSSIEIANGMYSSKERILLIEAAFSFVKQQDEIDYNFLYRSLVLTESEITHLENHYND